MPNILTPEIAQQPLLFDYLEEFQVVESASTYTNLGATKQSDGSLKQDSDDE